MNKARIRLASATMTKVEIKALAEGVGLWLPAKGTKAELEQAIQLQRVGCVRHGEGWRRENEAGQFAPVEGAEVPVLVQAAKLFEAGFVQGPRGQWLRHEAGLPAWRSQPEAMAAAGIKRER